MIVVSSSWQRRRSDFNHQWLKNRVLQALDSASNVMQGRLRGAEYLEGILQNEVCEWPERRNELTDLFQDFKDEMSPAKLFETAPLSEWDEDTKNVIAELVHQLWLVRYPVEVWLQSAKEAAAEVDMTYSQLLSEENMIFEGQTNPNFTLRFEAFRTACRKLSRAIEVFPNQVLVT